MSDFSTSPENVPTETVGESVGEPVGESVAPAAPLAELEVLIGELKTEVNALREGEFDAAALEQRLRELNELAGRAAAALDTATR